jgi:DNA-binding YbaB/EbfC family protein
MSGLGEMGNLLKQAQEMQRQVDRVRSELRAKAVVGQSGGGVVKVLITCDRHEVKGVEIAPDVLRGGQDKRLIEELIAAALQDALRRAEEIERQAIGSVTGGMHLPGFI